MKPITVARQEFVEELVKLINSAEIPAFAIADILRSCTASVEQLAVAQYNKDREEWNNGTTEG